MCAWEVRLQLEAVGVGRGPFVMRLSYPRFFKFAFTLHGREATQLRPCAAKSVFSRTMPLEELRRQIVSQS